MRIASPVLKTVFPGRRIPLRGPNKEKQEFLWDDTKVWQELLAD